MADIIWDKRLTYVYSQTDKARFDIINRRYEDFLKVVKEVNSEPVPVFDKLKEKQMQDLELIREVSRELQKKKIEDINKQTAVEVKETETEGDEQAEEIAEEPKEEELTAEVQV